MTVPGGQTTEHPQGECVVEAGSTAISDTQFALDSARFRNL